MTSDSPVIFGDRVETSNPYRLIYIKNMTLYDIIIPEKAGKSQQ